MLTSEQQKIYNVKIPKGGYGYYTLYHGIYDPENDIDERPSYAQTGDLFEPEGSSVVYKATRKNGKTTWAIDEDAQRQSESGESGGSGGSLPANFPAEGVANAGKFIGFDASGDYEAKNAPSGGGAEKFVVTLTKDDSGAETVWTADKTIAEIVAADAANKIVVAKYHDSGMYVELPLNMAVEYQGAYFAVFIGLRNAGNDNGIVSVQCVNEGSGDAIAIVKQDIPTLPEYSSSNNGQVLGVSSGSLAWVDNAPLIVTLTEDAQTPGTYVGDKTFGEVYTAVSAGKTVYISVTGGYGIVNACSLESGTYTIVGALEGMTFTGTENDYPTVTGN